MSREEAGRMGGEKAVKERGSELYGDIGKKGERRSHSGERD